MLPSRIRAGRHRRRRVRRSIDLQHSYPGTFVGCTEVTPAPAGSPQPFEGAAGVTFGEQDRALRVVGHRCQCRASCVRVSASSSSVLRRAAATSPVASAISVWAASIRGRSRFEASPRPRRIPRPLRWCRPASDAAEQDPAAPPARTCPLTCRRLPPRRTHRVDDAVRPARTGPFPSRVDRADPTAAAVRGGRGPSPATSRPRVAASGAMDQALSPEGHESGLIVAPAAEGLSPLLRPLQMICAVTGLDDSAVHQSGDDGRDLAQSDSDEYLVECPQPAVDVAEQDSALSDAQRTESEKVGVVTGPSDALSCGEDRQCSVGRFAYICCTAPGIIRKPLVAQSGRSGTPDCRARSSQPPARATSPRPINRKHNQKALIPALSVSPASRCAAKARSYSATLASS